MSRLKKRPELKLPETKVPDFAFNLYYDLKERRLLPLIGLLLVAIVAVPILIGGSDPEVEEEAAIATPSSTGVEASALAVARSAPGLRDYRRRLRQAVAADPFAQPPTGGGNEGASTESGGGAEVAASVSGGSETNVPAESSLPESATAMPSPAAAETAPAEGGSGGESTSSGNAARYASNTVDIRIVTVPSSAAASAKPKPQVRRGLPELTMLPNRKVPAAVFMGTTADGKKALLLVSSDVESIFGDGQCVVGSKTCQLLALEPGLPETFVYGPQGHTYQIEILKITKKVSTKPDRAPLGANKKKSQPSPGKQPSGKPESDAAGRPRP